MLEKIIAFFINFLILSSPDDWMIGVFKSARRRKFRNPLRELEIAQNHFNFCEPEYTSAAIFELLAAENKLKSGGRVIV